jgi:hypothetical protein
VVAIERLKNWFKSELIAWFLRNESPEQKLVKRIQELIKTFELKTPFKEVLNNSIPKIAS